MVNYGQIYGSIRTDRYKFWQVNYEIDSIINGRIAYKHKEDDMYLFWSEDYSSWVV